MRVGRMRIGITLPGSNSRKGGHSSGATAKWRGVSAPRYLARNRAFGQELGEGLFCSFNDAVLSVIGQVDEVSAIARNPNDEVGMFLRLHLCLP